MSLIYSHKINEYAWKFKGCVRKNPKQKEKQ